MDLGGRESVPSIATLMELFGEQDGHGSVLVMTSALLGPSWTFFRMGQRGGNRLINHGLMRLTK